MTDEEAPAVDRQMGLWGQPSSHTTASELSNDMFSSDLKRIARGEKRDEAERMDILSGKLSGSARIEVH